MRTFERKVRVIEDVIRGITGNVIVAGDFNARAIKWGMPTTDRQEQILLEMAARLDLVVANRGWTYTYRSERGNSIPDVTFVSARLMPRIHGWQVTKQCTARDHQYLHFSVGKPPRSTNRMAGQPPRWNLKKLNKESFERKLIEAPAPFETGLQNVQSDKYKANRLADKTEKLLEGL